MIKEIEYSLIGRDKNIREIIEYIESRDFCIHGVTGFHFSDYLDDVIRLDIKAVENNIVHELAKQFGLAIEKEW